MIFIVVIQLAQHIHVTLNYIRVPVFNIKNSIKIKQKITFVRSCTQHDIIVNLCCNNDYTNLI